MAGAVGPPGPIGPVGPTGPAGARVLALGSVQPPAFETPVSPGVFVTFPIDGTANVGAVSPITFTSGGGRLHVHFRAQITLPSVGIGDARAEILYRVDDAAPRRCAALRVNARDTIQEMPIVCDAFVDDVEAGTHDLAFDLRYMGSPAPFFGAEELSLVYVAEWAS